CPLRFPTLPGLVVYQDDEDPKRFHVLATTIGLAKRADGGPAFSVVSASRNGPAFISLTAELGATPAQEAAVRALLADGEVAALRLRPTDPTGSWSEIAVPAQPVSDAVLVPPLFSAGEARLVLGDGAELLADIVQAPSLFGANTASFSLILEKGTAQLADLVEGDGPIGTIRYDISFPARVPALTLAVKAHGEGPQEGETVEAAVLRGALEVTAFDAEGERPALVTTAAVLDVAAELWRRRPPGTRSLRVDPGAIIPCHLTVIAPLRALVPAALWEGLG
ncbi:MAG TPA: hypothetical protein DCQ35_10335, partial [Rhodospirillum rubrum]|nr:hypothetical protein [Rhodospirillum rubrum]